MTRVDYGKVAPGSVKAVYALEQYARASQLEPALIELVKLRASLINGCACSVRTSHCLPFGCLTVLMAVGH
jgi:hypothetical protein